MRRTSEPEPTEILAQACGCLLQNQEGVWVVVNGEPFVVWLDKDVVRIEARERQEKGIGDEEVIEHGRKVWMHNQSELN